jgi:hypothetical protein
MQLPDLLRYCSGDPGASPVPVPPGPAPRGDGVHAVRVRLRPPQPLLGLAGGQSRSPLRHSHWLAAPLHWPQSGESKVEVINFFNGIFATNNEFSSSVRIRPRRI